jgi:hypothetical protein
VVSVDVNRDGWPDLVSASEKASGLRVFLNRGSAGSSLPSYDTVAVPKADVSNCTAMAVGDIDGDEIADVVVGMSVSTVGSVVWLANTGTAAGVSFSAARALESFLTLPSAVTVVDVDGDGMRDVVAVFPNANIVKWYRSGGGAVPSFTGYVVSNTAAGVTRLSMRDFTRDGNADVVLTSTYSDSAVLLVAPMQCYHGQPCQPCPAGQFASDPGSAVCQPCSAAPGWACPVGSTTAQGLPCWPGSTVFRPLSAVSCLFIIPPLYVDWTWQGGTVSAAPAAAFLARRSLASGARLVHRTRRARRATRAPSALAAPHCARAAQRGTTVRPPWRRRARSATATPATAAGREARRPEARHVHKV